MSRPFIFRRFTVRQDKATFKVGTDSVLLGAWTTVLQAPTVLDIGTGTGLLALMAAQRGASQVLGIEPDLVSFAEAQDNFSHSPWYAVLRCREISLQQLVAEQPEPFRLIMANPPYFRNHLLSADPRMIQARHATELSLEELAAGVHQLLHAQGIFSVILPVHEFDLLAPMLAVHGLSLQRVAEVSSFAASPVIRKMGEFSRGGGFPETEKIFLYDEEKNRSASYRKLTEEFYLY